MTRRSTLRYSCVALTLGLAVSIGGAAAAEPGPGEAGEEITFGWFESDSFPDVYDRMTEASSAEAVADTLEAISNADQSHTLPGLSELTSSQRSEVIDEAVAAGQGEGTDSESPEFGVMTVWDSSAPIGGWAVASRWNWYFSDVYTWTTCTSSGCVNKGSLTYRFTTKPGQYEPATTWGLTRFSNGAPSLKLNWMVRASGVTVSDAGPTTLYPGSGISNGDDHSNMVGKTFQAYYLIQLPSPTGGTDLQEYRTPVTNTCTKPSGGAFRCTWP